MHKKKTAKETKIDILIEIGTFVLSILMGIGGGEAILCGGTALLYNRKADIKGYPIKVFIGNFIISVIFMIWFWLSYSVGGTEFGNVLNSLIIIPVTILLIVVLFVMIGIRFGLQVLIIYLMKKNDSKQNKAEI